MRLWELLLYSEADVGKMARLHGDQRNSWGSWWEIQDSLLRTIDMCLEKMGQRILVNSVSVDLKSRQCSLHKIKNLFDWVNGG